MSDSFDPYYKWLAIPPEEQPANHYRLLGVKLFESDSDVISNAADGRMAQVRTFQNGEHSARSQQLLNELAAARVCLLNPASKHLYDQNLQAARAAVAANNSQGNLLTVPVPPSVALPPMQMIPPPIASAPSPPVPLFSFLPNPAAPIGRKVHEQPKSSNSLMLVLAVGVLVSFGGISAGTWLLRDSGMPATGVRAVADAKIAMAAAKSPIPHSEDQETVDQESAKPSVPGETEKAVPPLAPAAETIRADAPAVSSSPTAMPVSDKPKAAGTLPGSSESLTPGMPPAKDAAPAARVPEPDAAPEKTAASPATDGRQPLPELAARKATLELVKEVYKEDYALAKKSPEKLALAEKLLKRAGDETDPVQRFVLLSEARNLALAGGGPQLLAEVAHQIAASFVIEEAKLLADSLDNLMDKAPTKAILAEIAEVAISGSDEAAANDQFEQAIRLANLAISAAKKAKQPETAHNIAARLSELTDLAQQYQASRAAEIKLAADPNDAEAHLALGKYLCFGKNDWDAGVPHLLAGNDPALQTLAKQEAQAPEDATNQVALADGWWDLADALKGSAKLAYQQRAAWWYQQAQEKLTGLIKSRADKRLQSLTETPESTGKSPAKTTSRKRQDPFKGRWVYLASLAPVSFSVLMDGGAAGKAPYDASFDHVVDGKKRPYSLRAHPPAPEKSSQIYFTLQKRFRLLSGAVGMMDGWTPATALTFRIEGDGKELWKSKPLQSGGQPVPFQVSVSGVSNLELFVDCPGVNYSACAVWVDPVLTK